MSGENPVKTILLLSANPQDTIKLRLDEEIREIELGLQRRSRQREIFEFKSGQAVRDFEIHRYILDYEPQIIHFSGHGTGESGLLFEDKNGQQKPIDAEALAGLFELFAEQVECVVLNACYSEIQAKAIAKHINYVIGMSQEIRDVAGIDFARGFYDALCAGKDIEFAYRLGCNAVQRAGFQGEHFVPKLLRKKYFCNEENINPTPVTTPPPQDTPTATSQTTPLIPRQEKSNITEYRQKVEEFASDGVISEIESLILNHLQQKRELTDAQAREIQKEVLEPYEIYKQQFIQKIAATGYPLKEKAQAELKKLQDYYKIQDEYVRLLNQEAEKQEAEKRLQLQRQQQEHENNLRRYEEELSKALKTGYPLDDYVRNGLKNYQQSLGLSDEDIAPIEQRLLAPKQAEYKRKQKEAERLKQEQELENQRQQAELQAQQQNKSSPPVSTPQSPSIIQTQTFQFETASLTVKTITQTRPGFLGFGKETSTSTTCEINRSRETAEYFKEDLGNGVFLEMVKIPGGSFLMGSPENEPESSSIERPQHKVNIQQFFMGKFSITQEQYQAIMGENKPVERVSWDNAVEFCDKISRRAEKTYRLPSEAEWEYACRAGTTTPFYFGETITTDLANYDGNYTYSSAPKGRYREQTTDVGSFPANAFGLYDMHGNVWEWCQDSWHENYNGAPTDGDAWIDNDNRYRVLRGGSWYFNPRSCRSAFRSGYERDDIVGFRVVVAFPRIS